MLEERDFQKKCDAALEDLKRRMLNAGDEHGFDVEGESGKLEVIFEEPEEAKFVISPNTPMREIWISALSTSFKLGWSEAKNTFLLEKDRRRFDRCDEPGHLPANRRRGEAVKNVLLSIFLGLIGLAPQISKAQIPAAKDVVKSAAYTSF